ncbi:MAG: AAA family ATPase [Magnetococcus sp. YQC-5]
MIIRRIRSENILRYKALDLNGLPEQGRILIAGPNESGKSAILETICLAIYGRTSNLTPDLAVKAVKWGCEQASVTLDFLGSDNIEYSLFRYFDADEVQRARLLRLDQETPVAQGVEAVNEAAALVVGFDYEQFTNALYLTHGRHAHSRPGEMVKELAGMALLEQVSLGLLNENNEKEASIAKRTGRIHDLFDQINQLNVIESALGVMEGQLSTAQSKANGSASTIERWESFDVALVQAAKRVEAATTRMANTTLDTGIAGWHSRCSQMDLALKELESICLGGHVEMETSPADTLRQWLTQLNDRLGSLSTILSLVNAEQQRLLQWLGSPGYTPTQPDATYAAQSADLDHKLEQLTRRHRHQGLAASLSLIMGIVFGIGVGVVLYQQQNAAFAPGLMELLAQYVPLWKTSHSIILMPTAIFFALLAIWSLAGRFRTGRQVTENQATKTRLTAFARQAQSTVDTIHDAANRSLEHQVEILSGMESTPWITDLQAWAQEEGRPFLDEKSLLAYMGGLGKRLKTFQEENTLCRQEAREQLRLAQEEHALDLASVATLKQTIEQEQARRQENARLHATTTALQAENQLDTRAMEVRRVARELLKGTSVVLSSHFNGELHRFISRTAPLFTQGRYRHLRIDDDLNVTVFSVAKNDFVQVEEISTGVRRQLTLAVRMALAQALATRTGGVHFLALDEPFAYFDRQRCRESLDALLRISDKITQIWVIAQEFDEESLATGLYIPCGVDQDVLVFASGALN